MPIAWTFFLDDRSFAIENYYLNREIHERALRSAGFREIHWHGPRVSPDGVAAHGEEFWATFLVLPADHVDRVCEVVSSNEPCTSALRTWLSRPADRFGAR